MPKPTLALPVFLLNCFDLAALKAPKKALWLAVLFSLGILSSFQAQITGQVTNEKGEPLPFVNIYFEGSLSGTTTNDNGFYELELEQSGSYTLIFKYLGFKTRKEILQIETLPFRLQVMMEEENIQLPEVAVSARENPADRVIRNAIAKRKEHLGEIAAYTADFYSKGLIKIEDAPEKILGQELGDLGGGLDSTRSGIIYLSETISKIARNRNEFKERIIASKVSGDDNGFSFNNASDVNFSFYENTVEFGNMLVSPIADNAFSYYDYELTGTFYENSDLINQISVVPKRAKDNVFRGTLYIVEDAWAIYALDLTVTGEQAQILPVDTIRLKQSFNYSRQEDTWVKVLQSIDFKYGLFGIKGSGTFTAGYRDYNLSPSFSQGDFTNEVLSFEELANKKDTLYWKTLRPVPLTREESTDYTFKDSIQVIRKSQPYMDSVDARRNKFSLGSLFFGYTYRNTFKEKSITFTTPVSNVAFNTVQGWHGRMGLDYLKTNEEKGTRFALDTEFNYGLSDRRFRPKASVSYRFDNFSRPYVRLSGGNEATQINRNNPIAPLGNSIASLFFENNLAKFFDLTFAELYYSQEAFNGFYFFLSIAYEDRDPLFNTTDYVIIDDDDQTYTSNNPLLPDDFVNGIIDPHNIWKLSVNTRIRFGQKYVNYPDGRFAFSEDRYPTLYLGYEKGFASSNSNNHFDQVKVRLTQEFPIADKGRFAYNIRAGAFINADGISFADFQHFNGNRTRVTRGNYLDSYFLLPYYNLSANQNYLEGHAEHNFKGFIMNRIPLLNKLNANLILSGKFLSTSDNSLYTEYGISLGNLGIKKFRFLRVGYVENHFRGLTERGFNIGVQF
jgi:hypothetical protein